MGEKGLLIQGEGTDRLFDCGLLGERRCPTIKAFVGKGEKTSWEPRRDRLGSAAAQLLKSLKPRTSSTGRVFFTGERKEITQLSFCCNKNLFQSLQSLLVLVGKHPQGRSQTSNLCLNQCPCTVKILCHFFALALPSAEWEFISCIRLLQIELIDVCTVFCKGSILLLHICLSINPCYSFIPVIILCKQQISSKRIKSGH